MNDVLAYQGVVHVDLGLGGGQVGFEVDPDSAKTSEIVENGVALKLSESGFEIFLKKATSFEFIN